MTGVFLESSIRVRSSDRTGHMVLTFQLAIRRAGTFLTFCFVYLGAIFQSICQAKTLSSKTIEAVGPWRDSTLTDRGLPGFTVQ